VGSGPRRPYARNGTEGAASFRPNWMGVAGGGGGVVVVSGIGAEVRN